jgi:hypothetical protein
MLDLPGAVDAPASDGVEVLVQHRSDRRHGLQLAALRDECGSGRLQIAGIIPGELCRVAGPPSQRQGMRKRVKALLSTGADKPASAQLLPPSAETMTLVIRPAPE